MKIRLCMTALTLACLGAPTLAAAQSRLPINEGVYAETTQSCATADRIWFYQGGRVGDLSFFGPNGSMGPDLSGVEPIESAQPARDGFTSINGGPIEVRGAGGEQIIVRAYSLANGEVARTRFRRCALSSVHPRMQAALNRAGYSERAGPVAGSPPPAARTGWTVSRGAGGVVNAQVSAASGLPELAVRCRGDMAYLHLRTSASERGSGIRRVEFIGSTTGMRQTESFQRDPETGNWSSGAGAQTLALLGGRDTEVQIVVAGQSLGVLSLVGSTAALGEALARCPSQGAVTSAGSAPTGEAQTVAPLNILAGHYVTEAEPCRQPFDMFYFDGARFGYYVQGNGSGEVSRVVSARQGREGWTLVGPSRDSSTQVRVLSSNRIQLISGPPMRWCPVDQVPRNRRVGG